MKINHMIIGSANVKESTAFYCQLFGFQKTTDNPGAEGGQVLHGSGSELLILPFKQERLPNPSHFAFEANDIEEFEQILKTAEQMQLKPRSEPARNSKPGFGVFKRGDMTFKNFYVNDPSGSNVEALVYI
jgi:catechol 2,3-dioxygenase-like lactoylglutathione lyase family enzyme